MAKELILAQETNIVSRAGAAARIRALADKVESLTFSFADYTVALPDEVNFKIEIDREFDNNQSTHEIELEIRWTPWEKMPPIAESLVNG